MKLFLIQTGKTCLVDKPNHLDAYAILGHIALGNKTFEQKLHFKITIQTEFLIEKQESDAIIAKVENLLYGHHFEANRHSIAVSIFQMIHPIKYSYLPCRLSSKQKLVNRMIKIYQRYNYE